MSNGVTASQPGPQAEDSTATYPKALSAEAQLLMKHKYRIQVRARYTQHDGNFACIHAYAL